jgi:hypothetical protein
MSSWLVSILKGNAVPVLMQINFRENNPMHSRNRYEILRFGESE